MPQDIYIKKGRWSYEFISPEKEYHFFELLCSKKKIV